MQTPVEGPLGLSTAGDPPAAVLTPPMPESPPTLREALRDAAEVMENVMREIDKLVGTTPIHPISAALLVTLEKAHQALTAPDTAIGVALTPVEINALARMHAQESLGDFLNDVGMDVHLRRAMELRALLPLSQKVY